MAGTKKIKEYAQNTNPASTDAVLIDMGLGDYNYVTKLNFQKTINSTSITTSNLSGGVMAGTTLALSGAFTGAGATFSGNVESTTGFSINGTPVGTSTDTYFSTMDRGIQYLGGNTAIKLDDGIIAKIDSLVSTLDGVVDVLYYDLNNDFDPNWSDKCKQHDWYSIDGAFPKQFVAIASNDVSGSGGGIRIYDATKQALTEYKHFEGNYNWSGTMLHVAGRGTAIITSLKYENGCFYLTSTNSSNICGFYTIDYLANKCAFRHNGGSLTGYRPQTIGGCNEYGLTIVTDIGTLVDGRVNDIAVQVLPASELDEYGRPIATVKPDTDGGSTALKDDGTAVDIVYTGKKHLGSVFTDDGEMMIVVEDIGIIKGAIPSSDVSGTPPTGFTVIDETTTDNNILGQAEGIVKADDGQFIRSSEGLTFIKGGLTAHITNSYNTGGMLSDIELCLTGDNLTDRSYNGITVTDNGSATFTELSGGLFKTTAVGGTITATVPTGGECYGWEYVTEWIFRENISDFVGVSESGGVLTIAEGTVFTQLKYVGSTPSADNLALVNRLEKAMFNNDTTFTGEIQDMSYSSDLMIATDEGLRRFSGIVNTSDFSDLNANLVTNGDFATDTDWDKGAGWSISGGEAIHAAGVAGHLRYSFDGDTFIEGRAYTFRCDIPSFGTGSLLLANHGVGAANVSVNVANGVGTVTWVQGNQNNRALSIYATTSLAVTIDNVEAREFSVDAMSQGNISNVSYLDGKLILNSGDSQGIYVPEINLREKTKEEIQVLTKQDDGSYGLETKLNIKDLNVSDLPTSSTGLSAGDIWSNSGVLTVV